MITFFTTPNFSGALSNNASNASLSESQRENMVNRVRKTTHPNAV